MVNNETSSTLEDVRTCAGAASADIQWVPIAELVLSDSPRTAGVDGEHTRTLAESGVELPPIVVQQGTNRVVDGRHRVRAAQLRGEEAVRARYFGGNDESAFVLAVRLNSQHGLPLTLADRREAAERILHTHATSSDRAIASVVGLSHKTVGALRRKAGEPAGEARIGRDGRSRPLSAAAGRERAREILERDQTSSLRGVSAAAGVSPGTVRDVRDQLRREAAQAIPSPRPAASARSRVTRARSAAARQPNSQTDRAAALRVLRTDPALRFTQSGRLLLSILAVAPMDTGAHDRLIGDLPDHCVGPVAELAAASAQAWQEFATRLDQRRSMPA